MSTLVVDHPQFDYVADVGPNAETAQFGRCHIRIFDQGGGDVVLLLTDASGEKTAATLSNAVEVIVTAAARRFALDPERLTVVEHSDDRWARDTHVGRRERTLADLGRVIELASGQGEERFAVLTFAHVPAGRTGAPTAADAVGADDERNAYPRQGDAFAGPDRRRVTKRQVEALIGQALP